MAAKAKKSTSKKTPSVKPATTVTRIKAADTKPAKKVTTPVVAKPAATKAKPTTDSASSTSNPLLAIGRYFKGAWFELRQVRWPNRKATWSLTAAVLIFSAFFVVLIVLLDIVFKYLFELILK